MEEIFLVTTEENPHHQLFCYIIKYPQLGETKERLLLFFISLTRYVSLQSLQCWRCGFHLLWYYHCVDYN
jgi:hypothetical protein